MNSDADFQDLNARIQALDAGLDAVLGEIHCAMSQGRDAKPLCAKLCPLVLVRTELMQRLSRLTQQLLQSFLPSPPLQAVTSHAAGPWPTPSWRSGP